MTTSPSTPIPDFITIGRHAYTVREDGYCPDLESYIARNADGRLITIPVD